MPFDINDNIVDIRNINNLDVTQKHTRCGLITAINSTFAYVNINNAIEEIPLEYIMYRTILD